MLKASVNSSCYLSTVRAARMDDREAKLGFKPQKEIPYNALLPYAETLDEESNDQLAHIKANLARVVQLRAIKIGGSHWTGQLSKLVRLFWLVRRSNGVMANRR